MPRESHWAKIPSPTIVTFSDMTADTINQNSLDNFIADASVDGNTLTLTKVSGDTVTFSKATSLSGAWSGRIFTVTATPQGDTKSGIVYDTLVPDTSIPVSKTGKNVKRTFIVYSDDGEGSADQILFRDEVSISADSVYTDGYNDGRPSSGTAGGRTSGVSALVHDFTITKGDGTTATLQIDVSSIYATARDGYYTQTEYNNYGTTQYNSGYNNGKPSSGTAGGRTSGVSALVHDFTITKGDGTTATLQIDVTSIYNTARSGYYTQAQYNTYGTTQYNSGYETGWKAGWDAYYDDTVDWFKEWDEGGGVKGVYIPKKIAQFDYYNSQYGRGKGNGSTNTSKQWFTYSSGGGGAITITVDSPLTAAAGQSAVDDYIDGCIRIYSSTNINKDGSYSKYYRFTVTAGGSSKKYYFRT